MKLIPLLALIPALLFAQTPWDGTANTSWYTSNPTATTYTISTAEQLAGLATLVNDGTTTFEGKTIKLGANIVLNDTNANGGWRNWENVATSLRQWASIGVQGDVNLFKGNFDGNGKVISGLYISTTDDSGQGLFAYATHTNISNLGLVGFYVQGSPVASGGIVGFCNSCYITNSYAIGKVNGFGDGGGMGGLAGSCVTARNSYFVGNVGDNSKRNGLIAPNCGHVTSSFYDSDIAGSNLSNGTPKTTAEMRQKSIYEGWDFGNVWGIGYPKDNPLNGGRPYLQGQTPVGQAQIQISDTTYTGSQIKPTPTVELNGRVILSNDELDFCIAENSLVSARCVRD